METPNTMAAFTLGAWRVDPRRNRVTGPAGSRALEPRVMDVLVALAEADGEPVLRSELTATVWKGVHVVDGALNRAIYQLRNTLGPDLVETVRGRGYRLTARVTGTAPRAPVPVVPRRTAMPAALTLILGVGLLVSGIVTAAPRATEPVGNPVLAAEGGQSDPVELASNDRIAGDWATIRAQRTALLRAEREAVRPTPLTVHDGPRPDPAPQAPAARSSERTGDPA